MHNRHLVKSWHDILNLPKETPESEVKSKIDLHIKKCYEFPNLIKRQQIGNITLCSYYIDMDTWDIWIER